MENHWALTYLSASRQATSSGSLMSYPALFWHLHEHTVDVAFSAEEVYSMAR
jgi:hypothetical protein